MKIILIAPVHRKQNFKRYFQIVPLNLMMIASLTPKDCEVEVLDENIDTIDYDSPVDLVGIGANTSEINRAYQICSEFRKRGVPVVIGGIHASALPDEAAQHADCVVIGEAEGLWEKVVVDFRKGTLAQFYQHQSFPDISKLPQPDREVLNSKRYLTKNVLQLSRGCPYHCIFCSATEFFGNTYRVRNEDQVIKEIERLDGDFMIFVDDNIFGDPGYAARLLQKMIPLKKKWVSQCTLRLADNSKLLNLAAKSGCMGMLIGVESISKDSLKASGKSIKFDRYKQMIQRILDSGIGVDGSFVFGFDNEDTSIFERTLEFIVKIKLPAATFSILTPYPGTQLMEKLEKEGRIIDRNWQHYRGTRAVFRPAKMTADQLEQGRAWIKQEFYSYLNIYKRVGFSGDYRLYLWLYNLLKRSGTTKGRRKKADNPHGCTIYQGLFA
ncbi:MAG: B12-binding domain-containing radical SAM protein [Desulfobacterales bacterium]|uniref:B12-binding domain-containing radical SAM protein n=1 Tax=Candidatus Desulfatibia vada TaxID=2841696 RepID=A0A8J6P6B3_9BACT|nr:B12-binding domain-containing radical SAM protein [Candidatus Desulfatibia vada]MBL6970633.1 B12-binding domain-containing radical SAM protein [Desulfobacterales bacterium]